MFKFISKKHNNTTTITCEESDSTLKQFYKSISCIVSADDDAQEVPDADEVPSFSGTLDGMLTPPQEEDEYVQFEADVKVGCGDFNLILDLDGTLVHTLPGDMGSAFGEADFENTSLDFYTFKRPGVDKFLKYCFEHFASVSVWTAGTQEYAKYIVDNITPKGRQFLYILSRENCSFHPTKEGTLVKDLHDIWNSFYGKELNVTRTNTIIIDDNEEVCFHNRDNSLIIPPWGIHTHGANDYLLNKLVFYFDQVAAENAKKLCNFLARVID